VRNHLKGARGAKILGHSVGPDGNIIISIQHHGHRNGDTVFIDNAQAIGVFVTPALFALSNYQIHLRVGAGKFKAQAPTLE